MGQAQAEPEPPEPPQPSRAKVILNPYAGRGEAGRLAGQVAAALRQAGVDFELEETTHEGEAIALAAAARRAGFAPVIAAGGDGTINEVMNGLAEAAGEGALVERLAVMPIGTGNDLADMLGCARDLETAARRIAAGRVRRIDLVKTTLTARDQTIVRYFANNMGFGFEAQVTLESYRIHRLAGTLRYLLAALRALGSFDAPEIEIGWETPAGVWEERRQRSLLVTVGNSARTGGVFYLTPDARLDDGLLDLGVAADVGRWRILMLMPKVLRGTHRGDPALELTRCTRLRLACPSTLPVHVDGEVVMRALERAEVEVQPGRLAVVV